MMVHKHAQMMNTGATPLLDLARQSVIWKAMVDTYVAEGAHKLKLSSLYIAWIRADAPWGVW